LAANNELISASEKMLNVGIDTYRLNGSNANMTSKYTLSKKGERSIMDQWSKNSAGPIKTPSKFSSSKEGTKSNLNLLESVLQASKIKGTLPDMMESLASIQSAKASSSSAQIAKSQSLRHRSGNSVKSKETIDQDANFSVKIMIIDEDNQAIEVSGPSEHSSLAEEKINPNDKLLQVHPDVSENIIVPPVEKKEKKKQKNQIHPESGSMTTLKKESKEKGEISEFNPLPKVLQRFRKTVVAAVCLLLLTILVGTSIIYNIIQLSRFGV
jgi:hypothetical protein